MRVLILGVSGQDGSYTADAFLVEGHEVFGLCRPTTDRRYVDPRVQIILGDVCDAESLHRALMLSQPHEVYNFAAQSHAAVSYDMPARTAEINFVSVARLLETVALHDKRIRVYQAITAEILVPKERELHITDTKSSVGEVVHEESRTRALNPYGCAKLAAWELCRYYREHKSVWVACGLPFTHESIRRPETFFLRKLTAYAARLRRGEDVGKLTLGNLDSTRDWGYAPDYVHAFRAMLDHEVPDDFVIATGEYHSVREAVEIALGPDRENLVEIQASLKRPSDYTNIYGDFGKAHRVLGWEPSLTFEQTLERLIADA